jgi:thiamine-phosphate pyrophosphorylase
MLRYAITDRLRLAPDEPSRLLTLASTWAATGIDYIQLREKDLSAAALATLARDLLAVLRAHTPPDRPTPKLLINSRADIALATRADGVHLTSAPGSLTPAQVRALYAAAHLPEPTISLSCHTLDDIAVAVDPARVATPGPASNPTLILFGPVFEKTLPTSSLLSSRTLSDPEPAEGESRGQGSAFLSAITAALPGTGLDLLRRACRGAAPVPVLALGGVTAQNTPACVAAGAAGIAAIRLFLPKESLT